MRVEFPAYIGDMRENKSGSCVKLPHFFVYTSAPSALLVRRGLGDCLCLKVRPYKHLKKLISVDVTDKVSCVIVCGYVGGVF